MRKHRERGYTAIIYLCQVLTLSLSQAKGPLQDFNTIHWNFDIYQEKVKTFKEIGFH